MTTDAINRVKEAEMKAKSLIDEAKQQAVALKKNSEKEFLKKLLVMLIKKPKKSSLA